MEMCSLKVLQPEGSPSRTLLRLMGERGCTTGHLVDYLQNMGHAEALQCLKPPGTLRRTPTTAIYQFFRLKPDPVKRFLLVQPCRLWSSLSL